MTNDERNPFNIIEESNSKTLDYFNKTYVTNLELVQNLKTELFELDVQIEALEKTRDLYTYQTDTRRNVFSPIADDSLGVMTKGKQLASQIKDLQDARTRLQNRISELERDIQFYKEQVEMLSLAQKCIHTVLIGRTHDEPDEQDDFGIEFIEEDNTENKTTHNYAMLQLEDYARSRFASSLEQNVRQELTSCLNKLDVLKWLLHSDIGRAKITLEEVHHSQADVISSLNRILDDLDYPMDTKQPVWDQINKLFQDYRQQHPECMIDANCDCTEHDFHLPPFISHRLIRMLREILDNIFKHSNANRVTSKICISRRVIDVYINDNGVGIPEDYLERSPWYSGLHQLHETIYQLDGKLQIEGDLISGTNIRFSFPIKHDYE